MFEYPLDLHYSQTVAVNPFSKKKFEYPLDLHYSQTRTAFNKEAVMFEYPLDLHYSQTVKYYFSKDICLNTLWIYTTLKRASSRSVPWPV